MESAVQNIMLTMNSMNSKMDIFMAELNSVKSRVGIVEEDLKNAFGEIYQMKDLLNESDQRNRSLTVRLYGVPLSPDERDGVDPNKAAAKTAYDRVLKPVLAAAKEKSLIPSLPTITNVILEAYRLKPKNAALAKPTPIVMKLISPAIKIAIFKAKRDSIPSPTTSEVDSGLRRFHLAEDLTPASYNYLMELRAHAKIERAWTTDGGIRFLKKGDATNFVHKVKSVFVSIDNLLG